MKGLQVTQKVRSYDKGKKMLRKRYEEVMKKIRKGTKLRRGYERPWLPSYEIVTPPIGIIYYDV